MNFLLKITEDLYNKAIISEAGFSETLLFGLEMLLLGMGAVFSVLCLIWGCLAIFSRVFSGSSVKASKEKVERTPVQIVETKASVSSNDEIVAVIAAAIAMAESENDGTKFRVVSFKRK